MNSTIAKEKVTLESIALSIEKLTTKNELNAAVSKLATKKGLDNAISRLATKDELTKSIDNLAGAVKKGFDEVHKKFEVVIDRLDNLEEKSATKTELYEVEIRLSGKIDILDDKVEKIYNYMGKAEVRAFNIENILFQDHGLRIKTLEKTVGV